MGLRSCSSEVVRASPADIRFSQESIPVCFDHPHEEDRLDKAVDLIVNNRLAASDFPHMNVVLMDNRLWTLNNRRLWVFRKAGVTDVFVNVIRRYQDEPHRDRFLGSNLHKILSQKQFYPWLREECRSEVIPPSHTAFYSFHEELERKVQFGTFHQSGTRSSPPRGPYSRTGKLHENPGPEYTKRRSVDETTNGSGPDTTEDKVGRSAGKRSRIESHPKVEISAATYEGNRLEPNTRKQGGNVGNKRSHSENMDPGEDNMSFNLQLLSSIEAILKT
ncbi:hypothetical protein R1flu_020949 [Riccia fluitans]|uniref:Uncharacterized protein n=1 Tax=Riccia fluitans TaxID=41844 RepID=A0ABD1ZPZ5_9MARC